MSKICYVPKLFTPRSTRVIKQAQAILEEYNAQGFVLTLRGLYYKFIARDFLPNIPQSYKRLGSIVGEARLAGLIDWEHLEDNSRNLALLEHFDNAQNALDKLAGWYHVDMWANQKWRPEVWVEKDAVVGYIRGVCQENDIPFFACRGYTSLSEMWRASLRLRHWMNAGQEPYIIHFGDHDPSGIDMSRDIQERIHQTFMSECQFERVALNMNQIEKYQPPPNPAKINDPRFKTYIRDFGEQSWELDALEPIRFRELIEGEVARIRDQKIWDADLKEKAVVKQKLIEVAANWNKPIVKPKKKAVKKRKPTKKKRGK